MPRTRSLAWSELKIGILAVVALALAALLIVAVGGETGFSWQRYELKTKFDNVQGLKSGAIVRVAGVEVGKVTDVQFSGAAVEVKLSVRNEMQPRVTTDSRASIGSLSLLGEPIIEITPASTGRPLQAGEYVQAGKNPGQISDVATSATQTLDQVNALLSDIRGGKGTVGKLFTDEQVYKEFTALLNSANAVTSTIAHGNGTLGLLSRDPKAYNQLTAALSNLQDMTARINAGEGSLGQLLKDDRMAKSLANTSANFERISDRLNKGEGTAGKLLTDKALYDRLDAITNKLDQTISNLNQGQGTAGQLLHDKQLYDNMNGAANELKSLIADIRKDPKKYLNVKVSIF
jgi:phospholipid/cholesterol/gamma-HCH transport system substrate-binding protein